MDRTGMPRRAAMILLAVLGLSTGCAGVSAGGPTASASTERASTDSGTLVNQDIGRVDAVAWQRAMEKILIGRYRFAIRRREERFQTLYYETAWVLRPPTEEEQQRGIIDARHRVVINGRRVGGGAGGLAGQSDVYSLSLRVEHQVRQRTARDWHAGAVFGGSLEQDMHRMVSDLRLEVRSGRSR